MKTFNTGRQYTAEGQIINYVIADIHKDEFGMLVYNVLFNDISRCINGWVEFVAFEGDNSESSIQNRIMDAYDGGNYTAGETINPANEA